MSWTAHYGQHHIKFWTACRAGRKFCRSAWRTKGCKYKDRLSGLRTRWSQPRLLIPTLKGDISKFTQSGYKTHFLKVTFIFPIKTWVKNLFWPLFPFKPYALFINLSSIHIGTGTGTLIFLIKYFWLYLECIFYLVNLCSAPPFPGTKQIVLPLPRPSQSSIRSSQTRHTNMDRNGLDLMRNGLGQIWEPALRHHFLWPLNFVNTSIQNNMKMKHVLKSTTLWRLSSTVVLGPIWTNLVLNIKLLFS